MMTRAEKLFNIQAQVQKALSEIYHGDHAAVELAFADALAAMVRFLEEEMPEKISVAVAIQPESAQALEPESAPPKPESESARIGRIKVPKK